MYRYFIDWKSDGDSYFTIDGTEGTIATNELLDRESTAQYNFSIIASKVSKYGITESMFSCTSLHLTLLNESLLSCFSILD